MNEKVMQLSTIQQIWNEFGIIGLTALVAAAFIWVYLSINLLWTAVMYFAFLLSISFIYGTFDYHGRDAEVD